MKRLMSLVTAGLLAVTLVASVVEAGGRGRVSAPDFEFKCPKGHRHHLSDLKGKVVVLDFWASWCGPCRRSLPKLQALYERYKSKDIVFLGINSEDPETIAEAKENMGLEFWTVQDEDNAISEAFDVEAIPRTVVIDAEGRISANFTGYRGDDSIEQAILQVLSRQSANAAAR